MMKKAGTANEETPLDKLFYICPGHCTGAIAGLADGAAKRIQACGPGNAGSGCGLGTAARGGRPGLAFAPLTKRFYTRCLRC